eukprot:jgi/Chrpa1/11987/Chrysochromulina_OHIO_Genome00013526-RA
MLRLLTVALPLVVALLAAFDEHEVDALQLEVQSPLQFQNAGKTIQMIYFVTNLFTTQGYQPTIRRQPQMRAVGLDGHRAPDISAATGRRDVDTTTALATSLTEMESDSVMLEAPALSARRVGALIDPSGAPTATEPGACSSPRPPGVPRPSQDKTFLPPTAVCETTPGSSYQLHEDNNTSVAAGQGATHDEPLAVHSDKTTATALTSTATQSDETYSSELATINGKPGSLCLRHEGNASAASSEQTWYNVDITLSIRLDFAAAATAVESSVAAVLTSAAAATTLLGGDLKYRLSGYSIAIIAAAAVLAAVAFCSRLKITMGPNLSDGPLRPLPKLSTAVYLSTRPLSVEEDRSAMGTWGYAFDTQWGYDFLRIPSHPSGTLMSFSGYYGPDNVILGQGAIQWSSDGMVTFSGWRVCSHSWSPPPPPRWPPSPPRSPPPPFPPPLPPFAPGAYFAVTSGPCTVDPSAPNCIRSPNFPSNYSNSQALAAANATVIRLGLTFAGAVSDYSATRIATLKDALSANLSCTAPACVTTLRLSAASVLFSIDLTIPVNGTGNPSAALAAVAQATAAANALAATPLAT